MSAWTSAELTRIGASEEVEVSILKRDGTLRDPVTVWLVRAGDDLYVRSAVKGSAAAWFRALQETHEGQIRASRLEKVVSFVEGNDDVLDEVDRAYRSKYRRYGGRILNSCLTPEARATTVKVLPR